MLNYISHCKWSWETYLTLNSMPYLVAKQTSFTSYNNYDLENDMWSELLTPEKISSAVPNETLSVCLTVAWAKARMWEILQHLVFCAD